MTTKSLPTDSEISAIQNGALLVLGMHRSGTSALTGSIVKLGLKTPFQLMPATDDNPKGYWESVKLVQVHDRIFGSAGLEWYDTFTFPREWHSSREKQQFHDELDSFLEDNLQKDALIAIKDPRISRIATLWTDLLDSRNAMKGILISVRRVEEVSASLLNRDQLPIPMGHLLWLRYMLDAEFNTRNTARSFIDYEQLLKDPKHTLSKAANDLSIQWPRQNWEQVYTYLDEKLHHHQSVETEPEGFGELQELITEVTEALSLLVEDPNSNIAQSKLDHVRTHIEQQEVIFTPSQVYKGRTCIQLKEDLGACQASNADHNATITNLNKSNSELKEHIQALEKSNFHLEKKTSLLEQQDINLQQHGKNLEQQLENRQQHILNITQHADNLQHDVNNLKEKNQDLEREIIELKDAKHSLNQHTDSLQSQIVDLEKRNLELTQHSSSLNEITETGEAPPPAPSTPDN